MHKMGLIGRHSPSLNVLLLTGIAIFSISMCIPAQADKLTTTQKKLAKLEASSGGRIGISAIDTANNTQIQYRSEERFPMNSTSKVMVVGAILKQSMTNHHLLQQKVIYTQKDLDFAVYTPVTKKHLSDGMTISDLCSAAITQSDSAAMNLLILITRDRVIPKYPVVTIAG